jgi:hypothetical protein
MGVGFIAKVFTKFQPEKDDFNLYNGFFMEKKDQNSTDF